MRRSAIRAGLLLGAVVAALAALLWLRGAPGAAAPGDLPAADTVGPGALDTTVVPADTAGTSPVPPGRTDTAAPGESPRLPDPPVRPFPRPPRDTAPVADPPPGGYPGRVRIELDSAMMVERTSYLTIEIAKGEEVDFPLAPPESGRQRVGGDVLVGDTAIVCVGGDPSFAVDFAGPDSSCAKRYVEFGVGNRWVASVTPTRPGRRQLLVTVFSMLVRAPIFERTYAVEVLVEPARPKPPLERLQELLTTWQGILGSLVAIGGAVAAMRGWLRRREDRPDP